MASTPHTFSPKKSAFQTMVCPIGGWKDDQTFLKTMMLPSLQVEDFKGESGSMAPTQKWFLHWRLLLKKKDVFPWGKQQNTTIWHPPTIMEVETCPIVKENHLEGILFPLPWLWRKSNPVFVVPCICGTNVFHMWVENRRHQSFY